MPSYIDIANSQENKKLGGSGVVKSSSTSSVPSLANVSELLRSDRNSMTNYPSGNLPESIPNLTPGTPPELVDPDACIQSNDISVGSSMRSFKTEAFSSKGTTQTKLEGALKKPLAISSPAAKNRSSGDVKISQNGISKDVKGTSSAQASSNSFELSFPSNSFASVSTLQRSSHQDKELQDSMASFSKNFSCPNNPISPSHANSFSVASSVSYPSTNYSSRSSNASTDFKMIAPAVCQSFLDSKMKNMSGLNVDNKPSISQIKQQIVSEPSILDKTRSKCSNSVHSFESQVITPIRYAKEANIDYHGPVPNFASPYIMSPKVDKAVHHFNFDDENEVKIVLNNGYDGLKDEVIDDFVCEIHRSFNATPVPLEVINVDDLQPPEFYRSLSSSKEELQGEATEDDGEFEEHDMVLSKTYERETKSEMCTVSKSKLLTRNSACPDALKEKARSHLGMLSTLSALSKSKETSPLNQDNSDISPQCSEIGIPSASQLPIEKNDYQDNNIAEPKALSEPCIESVSSTAQVSLETKPTKGSEEFGSASNTLGQYTGDIRVDSLTRKPVTARVSVQKSATLERVDSVTEIKAEETSENDSPLGTANTSEEAALSMIERVEEHARVDEEPHSGETSENKWEAIDLETSQTTIVEPTNTILLANDPKHFESTIDITEGQATETKVSIKSGVEEITTMTDGITLPVNGLYVCADAPSPTDISSIKTVDNTEVNLRCVVEEVVEGSETTVRENASALSPLNPTSNFAPASTDGSPGLVYTAQVRVQQTSSLPGTPVDQPSG